MALVQGGGVSTVRHLENKPGPRPPVPFFFEKNTTDPRRNPIELT